MTIVFEQQAQEELEAAYEFYERSRAGLGAEFVDEFRRGIENIQRFPGAWAALDNERRRYQLNRFPWGIIYLIDSAADEVIVTAVVHLHSDPRNWR